MSKLGRATALLTLGISVLALPVYPAQEQQKSRSGEWASFQKLDADGNGMISKEEAAAMRELDFSQVDRNNDGQLSKSEYEAAKGGQKGRERSRQQQPGGERGKRY